MDYDGKNPPQQILFERTLFADPEKVHQEREAKH